MVLSGSTKCTTQDQMPQTRGLPSPGQPPRARCLTSRPDPTRQPGPLLRPAPPVDRLQGDGTQQINH